LSWWSSTGLLLPKTPKPRLIINYELLFFAAAATDSKARLLCEDRGAAAAESLVIGSPVCGRATKGKIAGFA